MYLKSFSSIIPVVLYINLKHRTDRSEQFLSNFSNYESSITLIRIDAIKESNGELGCLKSHIKALKYALENYSNREYILICEDDFYIPNMKYCEKMLNNFFGSAFKWDVLMLSHNTVYLDQTTYSGVIKILDSQTASGYLIKLNYIPKLLKIYEDDLCLYNKTQIWKSEYCNDQSWKRIQKFDNWYSFLPRVAVQRPSYSDIVGGNVNYNL
jgi:glycosyl transferase family 25